MDGNNSICLPLLRSFYKAGFRITLACPNVASAGYFSRYANRKIIWPRDTGNELEFKERLIDHARSNSYELDLGLSEVISKVLYVYKKEIDTNVKKVVPDFKIFAIAGDKYMTMQHCMRIDNPYPDTFSDEEEIMDSLKKTDFPCSN